MEGIGNSRGVGGGGGGGRGSKAQEILERRGVVSEFRWSCSMLCKYVSKSFLTYSENIFYIEKIAA